MFLNPRRKKGRRHTRRHHSRKHRSMLNPRKRRSGRKGRRRSSRGGGMSMGGIVGSFKQAFSKQILATGAGLYAGDIVTKIVIAKWGSSLPGVLSADGKTANKGVVTAYAVAIPVLFGFALRKRFPNVATGAYLSAIGVLINQYVTPAIASSVNTTVGATVLPVSGTNAYIRSGMPLSGVGRLPGPRNHTAVDQFSNFPGQKAIFATNAWSRGR